MAYTTINKSGDYFNTKLYTGNGGTQTITGVGFQSDFTWFKSRSATNSHSLLDIVRGLGYALSSNLTGAQIPVATQTFNSDGYVLANDGGAPSVNPNGVTTVAWNWKANGTGSANTDGTINSTVSANTTAGFSIVKWTSTDTAGSTMGHGLGAIPKMIITKKLASGSPDYWTTYNSTIGNTKSIFLNDTGAMSGASTSYWNDTSPTSSVFSTGTYFNAGDYIAYCFAEKQGYSKFGSYTGNGNADGTFVYTGFKPAFVIIKNTSTSGTNWVMFDNKRIGYNESNYYLRPNGNNAESTNIPLDILSNGFKIRTTAGDVNTSGNTYIYMAFAEAPLVGSNNVPCTAR